MASPLQKFAAALCVSWAAICVSSCSSPESGSDTGSTTVSTTGSVATPGGFVEQAGSAVRPRWTTDQLESFLPSGREQFTFPAPYNTQGVRLTIPGDCAGADCVWNVGYSYWRNTNNHINSDRMLIFLALDRVRGGAGPTLFSYDKTTDQVTSLGPLFDSTDRLSWSSAVGWYFSATLPTKLYLNDGPRMMRYDVLTKESEVVYDITSEHGADRKIKQMYSSNDDQVHSATLSVASNGKNLGCMVYREADQHFLFYPAVGLYDECQIDKSGHHLLILEEIDGRYGVDNRLIDLDTGVEKRLLNLPGAGSVGHHDLGYGYAVGHDNFNNLPNATASLNLVSVSTGPVNHRDYNWDLVSANHISHTNAQPGIPMEQQYACGSNADRVTYAQNEILCFSLDGSLDQLVIAPVMTNLDASGGRNDYEKAPKGNLDVTGKYFIWTTNLGSNRLDAFVVKVPGHLLSRL